MYEGIPTSFGLMTKHLGQKVPVPVHPSSRALRALVMYYYPRANQLSVQEPVICAMVQGQDFLVGWVDSASDCGGY